MCYLCPRTPVTFLSSLYTSPRRRGRETIRQFKCEGIGEVGIEIVSFENEALLDR